MMQAGAVAASTATATAPQPPSRPLDDAWAVDRVVDGDTIDTSDDRVVLTVRLIGINAPEHDGCWGSEAADASRACWATDGCGSTLDSPTGPVQAPARLRLRRRRVLAELDHLEHLDRS